MSPAIDKDERTGLWKDEVNRKLVRVFARSIAGVYPKFQINRYVREVVGSEFIALELKDRIDRMARKLGDFLPDDFNRATNILIKSAPEIPGFGNWVLTRYVDFFGQDHFEIAVNALSEITKFGTSEFAIRSFVNANPKRMITIFRKWAKSSNEHIRRLAAEGSRPRGVWVAHIGAFRKDPTPVIKLLDLLRDDPSLYVRKAVANNLNDISKDHPKAAIAVVRRWKKDKSERTDWIIKHGCRSLIKQGYPEVFPLLGFTAKPKVDIQNFLISPKKIKIGENLKISVELKSGSTRSQYLAIDYCIHYLKKSGKLSPKVFKWSEKALSGKERLQLSAKRSFKDMSTRKHLPGKHRVELFINGQEYGILDFVVTK